MYRIIWSFALLLFLVYLPTIAGLYECVVDPWYADQIAVFTDDQYYIESGSEMMTFLTFFLLSFIGWFASFFGALALDLE